MDALRRFVPSRCASAAIEFAIVAPVMLLLMAGTVEFGRAFQAYRAANQLASRYASTWADCSDYPVGTCNSILATYTALPAIQNLVPQLVSSQITIRMMQFQMAASSAQITYASPFGTAMMANEFAAAQNAVAPGQTGVVVTVAYVHNLTFFRSLMSTFFPAGSVTFTFTIAQDKS